MASLEQFKHEDFNQFYVEFQSESDRACALLGAAFIDEQLRALLAAFFIDDDELRKRLFSIDGPIGPFGTRIHMAYGLGFLATVDYRDLRQLSKIRNAFAHQLHGLTFESEQIKSSCGNLQYDDFLLKKVGPVGPRVRYIWCVARLANLIALRRLGLSESRRTVPEEVKTIVVNA